MALFYFEIPAPHCVCELSLPAYSLAVHIHSPHLCTDHKHPARSTAHFPRLPAFFMEATLQPAALLCLRFCRPPSEPSHRYCESDPASLVLELCLALDHLILPVPLSFGPLGFWIFGLRTLSTATGDRSLAAWLLCVLPTLFFPETTGQIPTHEAAILFSPAPCIHHLVNSAVVLPHVVYSLSTQ